MSEQTVVLIEVVVRGTVSDEDKEYLRSSVKLTAINLDIDVTSITLKEAEK